VAADRCGLYQQVRTSRSSNVGTQLDEESIFASQFPTMAGILALSSGFNVALPEQAAGPTRLQ
jgi:hypothetical protein